MPCKLMCLATKLVIEALRVHAFLGYNYSLIILQELFRI